MSEYAWTTSPSTSSSASSPTFLCKPFSSSVAYVLFLAFVSFSFVLQTSKNLYAVTHLRALWAILFRTHILDQHIPYPDIGPLDDLSAQDLEALTRRALALRHTWSSPQPVPRRNITFGPPSDPVARVIFLQFLPGRSNRYLISVRMTSRPRAYLLQCWDVAPDHPKCVAELVHADGPYGGVVLNSDPSSSAVLAMQSAMYVLRPTPCLA